MAKKSFDEVMEYLSDKKILIFRGEKHVLPNPEGNNYYDLKLNGLDDMVLITEKELKKFVKEAVYKERSTIKGSIQHEIEREESPGYPNYMWYESNVHYWTADILITLNLRSDEPKLDYFIFNTGSYWTGF